MPVSRRTVLAGGIAAAIGPGAGFPLAQVEPGDTPDLDQFIAASARLLGVASASLDRTAAERILAGLMSFGYGPGVVVLADDATVTSGVVADEIVAAWYSGIAPTLSGPELVLYTDAQLWSALDYTKPFAFCGGETGYWAEPPER